MIKKTFISSLGLFCATLHGQANSFYGQVHCVGLMSVSTKTSAEKPEIAQEKSTNEIWLTRKGAVLWLRINPGMYATLDAKSRRELQKPDEYKIVGETGEGLMAIRIAPLRTTEETFILRSDEKRAIWVETAFSFLPPQSEPLSNTVSFTCKRVK